METTSRETYNTEELNEVYNKALPFPYIVLDNFLPEAEANKLAADFPENALRNNWIHYKHYNENKHGLNLKSEIPLSILKVIESLNAPEFVSFLERVTGIKGLIADNTLEGGGIHISKRGGFLNIHADFETHPKDMHLLRRINVLLYLNKNWKKEYKGDLEFWSADMKSCVAKIAPLFNRLVIFNTTNISYHGFSEKLECPADETRKSIALYFYTRTATENPIKSTVYKTKPGEGIRAIPNWIDNKMIFVYTYIKRRFGISDQFISKLLLFINPFSKDKR